MNKTWVLVFCVLLAVPVLGACQSRPEPVVAVEQSSGMGRVFPERADLLKWASPVGKCAFKFTANCMETHAYGAVHHYKCSGMAPKGGSVTVFVFAYRGNVPVCIAAATVPVKSSGDYQVPFSVDHGVYRAAPYTGRIDVDVVAADDKGVACLSACDKLEP